MKPNNFIALLALTAVTGLASACSGKLAHVGGYHSGEKKGTEIVSVQQVSHMAAVTNSSKGFVDILDLSDPTSPRRTARYDLMLADGEELTSVALHPEWNLFAAGVRSGSVRGPGRLILGLPSSGAIVKELPTGFHPDCVEFDPTGNFLVVANEGEDFDFDAGSKTFSSPPGSITVVDLRGGIASASVIDVPLPDVAGIEGMPTVDDKRFLERPIDINGDGEISGEMDFDGDGQITRKKNVTLGQIDYVDVRGREDKGEEEIMVPIANGRAKFLEPEYVAFSPDGMTAYVTLQENNAIAVVNLPEATVERIFGLGTTTHMADLTDEEDKDKPVKISFTQSLTAFREPDGLAVSPSGKWIFTADEGDTEPKAAKTPEDLPRGGGRTMSVFDAATGMLLGDTGNQIDEAANAAGVYPDGRSDSKGSEPETVIAFERGGVTMAIVALERASALALVEIKDPARPTVKGVYPLPRGSEAPEGIALYHKGEKLYVLCANEKSGDLSVFEVK